MDNRLMTCVKLCQGGRVADIGTDHGYLPCYMVKNGLCTDALACDVAPKPLESAKAHIRENGLEDRITAILSDGLKNVPLKGVTDIVISGMGGELISAILENCPELKSAQPAVNLVLQPMTKWDVLRSWLFENGFEVTSELPCIEGKFVYSVMQARYTVQKPPYECDLRYLYCGLVTHDTPEGKEYLCRQALRLKTIGEGKLSSPNEKKTALQMLKLSEEIFSQTEAPPLRRSQK